MSELTEPGEGWVERAMAGDRDAFDELAEAHRPRVAAMLRGRRAVPEHDLEDILQETFLRAFRSIDTFRPGGETTFFRWLSGIAANVNREMGKKRARTPLVPEYDAADSKGLSQSRAMRRNERFERLERAIDELPDSYREVVRLVRLQGLAVKDVAERLGKTPNAISRLLLRASTQLRESFGDTESLSLPDRSIEPNVADGTKDD